MRRDFDGDGEEDVAIVLTADTDGAEPLEEDRLLVVALADGEGYRRVLETSCIALCTGCGGVFGDPYSGMQAIGTRSLKVDNYGGSSWRWSAEYTLAWREGRMMVVGYDASQFQSTAPEEDATTTSLNLLTGKATLNEAPKRHDQGPVAADDCMAVGRLGATELR